MRFEDIKRLGLVPLMPLYMLQLHFHTQNARAVDDYIRIAESTRLRSLRIKPIQISSELKRFAEVIAQVRPRRVLEIGTARGGTLYLFCRLASPDAQIISVDLPGGDFGKGYPFWRIPLYNSFARRGQYLHLLRGDSHDSQMLARVRNLIGKEQLDFLFIDGDHRYEGVKRDFEMYSVLVRPGGTIAFHDIVPGPPVRAGGVAQFWREIKKEYRHSEIVEDWDQGGYGIGLLFSPEASEGREKREYA